MLKSTWEKYSRFVAVLGGVLVVALFTWAGSKNNGSGVLSSLGISSARADALIDCGDGTTMHPEDPLSLCYAWADCCTSSSSSSSSSCCCA